MAAPSDPVLDPARLAAVHRVGLLDTPREEVFDAYARTAATLLGAPFAFITIVDDARSFWKSRIGIDSEDPAHHQNTVEESFCQYVVRSDEDLMLGDVRLNPLTAINPSIDSMGVRAWAGFPLHAPGGEVLGSFCVVDTEVRTWTDRDRDVLKVLSDAAAREIALRDALALLDEAAQARDRANANIGLIARAAQSLGSSLRAEDSISDLASLVVPDLGDWSVVSLIDDDHHLQDIGWAHVDDARLPILESFVHNRHVGLADNSATTTSRRTGEPTVVVENGTARALDALGSSEARAAIEALKPESWAVFPLVGGAGVAGVLAIMRGPDRPPLNAAELETATVIAHRAAVALENARLYRLERQMNSELEASSQHSRSVAISLQQAMLSTLPERDHLQLEASYVTADRADDVGGDWYDAVVTKDGATTLVIGDVAGHDIAAAAIMGQLRNMVRAFIWSAPHDSPADLITRLDQAMAAYGIWTMTTLFVARVEQTDADADAGLRQLRWSCAGHPHPILTDRTGRARLVGDRADPPVGIGMNLVRTEQVTSIGPGATLLLYTDGLFETRDSDYDDRLQQLAELVGRHHGEPIEELISSVVAAMVGDDPDDDVAVLGVRFGDELVDAG